MGGHSWVIREEKSTEMGEKGGGPQFSLSSICPQRTVTQQNRFSLFSVGVSSEVFSKQ